MLSRALSLAAATLLLSGVAEASEPADASAVEPAPPALARLKELLTSTSGQLKAPASPRFASLRDPSERGTRFLVGWVLPCRASEASALSDALGGEGGGMLAPALPALGGRVTSSVTVEDIGGTAVLVIAVSSTRRGVEKELELGVLAAVTRLGEATSLPSSSLARRALTPVSRVVVEVHPPEAARSSVRLPKPLRHVIERGDTLSEIAHSHGLELEALVRLNGVDPNKPIRPGDELKLDAGTTALPKLYVAKPGDTLAKVAKHFGISEKALVDANRLEARHLSPGQKLVLPR